MQFQLPQTLAQKVAEYDPALKPIIQAAKAAKGGHTPRMSLGLPTGLFPAEFLTAEEQKQWAIRVNKAEEKERAFAINNDKGCGVLVYKSSIWIALWYWHPSYLQSNPKDYLFGCTLARKNTPATIGRTDELVRHRIGHKGTDYTDSIRFTDVCCTREAVYGRIKMIEHTVYVTTDLVVQGLDVVPGTDLVKGWGRTDSYKRQEFVNWRRSLSTAVSVWKDAGTFARIKEQGDIRFCIWPDLKKDSTSTFHELVTSSVCHVASEKAKAVIGTPFFKKEINKMIDECLAIYHNPINDLRKNVTKPMAALSHKIGIVKGFLEYYPDATVDHCQQIYAVAHNIQEIPQPERAVREWVRENMPVASFIQVVEKEVEKLVAEWAIDTRKAEYDTSHHTGLTVGRMRELYDTISMLDQLHYAQCKKSPGERNLEEPLQLAKPSRWRISEFHDYVSAECFKISTPNEKLRQDLFPQPVKVELSGRKWSFFQPHDVHQLAAWGAAVRNCVGNSDSYKKGIKNKTHFIVLAMLDNVPRFTIQLKLRDMNLHVEQIADTCNRRLSPLEQSQYTEAFGIAIKQIAAD